MYSRQLIYCYNCVIRDLDQASMEAVAALLAGLPLQPEESDRGDLMEAKSQLFLKYVVHCFDISVMYMFEVARVGANRRWAYNMKVVDLMFLTLLE